MKTHRQRLRHRRAIAIAVDSDFDSDFASGRLCRRSNVIYDHAIASAFDFARAIDVDSDFALDPEGKELK